MQRLSVIADRAVFESEDAWLAALRSVAEIIGGDDDVRLQVRVKGIDSTERARALARAAQVLDAHRSHVTLNGTVAEALEAGFGGAHLPEADIPALPPVIPPLFLLGASIHSPGALRRAVDAGVSFVQFGPVFDAGSKAARGVGLQALAAITSRSPVPVIAVGGITPANTGACFDAGASGVAVITGIFRAPHVASAIASYQIACSEASGAATLAPASGSTVPGGIA